MAVLVCAAQEAVGQRPPRRGYQAPQPQEVHPHRRQDGQKRAPKAVAKAAGGQAEGRWRVQLVEVAEGRQPLRSRIVRCCIGPCGGHDIKHFLMW